MSSHLHRKKNLFEKPRMKFEDFFLMKIIFQKKKDKKLTSVVLTMMPISMTQL
jgi:hypothetical protein